jgi:twitching motility protein PilT
MTLQINDLLQQMVARKASDLHVHVGSPPGIRADGEITPLTEHPVVTPELARDLANQLMSEDQRKKFEEQKDIDFGYAVPGLARFRVNVLVQRSSVGIVMRQIPEKIPSADDLGLPQICKDLAAKPRGLVLVTGPTGSGKSTTLAAMLDYINQTEAGHILTMEDPVEFIHKDKKCFITQRQIGQDTASFKEALRRALRQDPDVILIGEMRDLETISMAITAAETGHLVFGTLHTTTAISTIDRVIDVFPTEAQQQVRVQLAATLQGVVSQCLVEKIGGGRVAAREILVATDGVRALVREGKTPQILNLMQTGKGVGMTTLEGELTELVNKGVITLEAALGKANRPSEVEKQAKPPAQGMGGGMGGGVQGRTRPAAAPPPAAAPARSPGGSPARPAGPGGASPDTMKSLFGR